MAERQFRSKGSNITYLVGMMIGLIVLVIIAIQNSGSVELRLIFYTFEQPLSLFLTMFFILGFLIGLLSALINLFRKDRVISKQNKHIKNIEKELEDCRNKSDDALDES